MARGRKGGRRKKLSEADIEAARALLNAGTMRTAVEKSATVAAG